MKKMKAALAAMTIVALTFTACSGDDGAAGPAGAAGNANVDANTFSLTTADWTRTGNSALSYDTLSVPGITQDVVDNGAVQVYQTFNDSLGWNALPYRYLTVDQSGQSVTNANIQSVYNVGNVFLSFYTDARLLANINDMEIKVVVIPSSSLIKGIDVNNYEELKMVYGIDEYDLN